jgi:hypothetical protein
MKKIYTLDSLKANQIYTFVICFVPALVIAMAIALYGSVVLLWQSIVEEQINSANSWNPLRFILDLFKK